MNFKIFFINLNKNLEIFEKAKELFSLLPDDICNSLERIEAIDTTKNLNLCKEMGFSVSPHFIGHKLHFFEAAGSIGQYLSHYTVWQKIISENLDLALVLEDDSSMSDVMNFLLSDPDIDESLDFIQLHKLKVSKSYLINNSGANKLINLAKDHSCFSHIDPISFVNNNKHNLHKLFKKYPNFDYSQINTIHMPISDFIYYSSSNKIPSNLKINFIKFNHIKDLPFSDFSDIYCCYYRDKKSYINLGFEDLEKKISSENFKNFLNLNTLTLCICTYNNFKLLKKSFASALNQSFNKDLYNIIILDNTPGSIINQLSKEDEGIRNEIIECASNSNISKYIHRNTNGLSGARNECIKESSSDLIYFIDDDCILHENSVEFMTSKFSNPKIGVAGGKTIPDWQGYSKPSWLSKEQSGSLSLVDFSDKDIFLHEYTEPIWLVGANICFRKSCLEEVGGFNLSLGRKGLSNSLLSGEEDEVVKKISNKHLSLYTPDCIATHIIDPERLNQSWFLKRTAWQSVSNYFSGSEWLINQDWAEDFVSKNIHYLFKSCDSQKSFDIKSRLVLTITFLLLNGKI